MAKDAGVTVDKFLDEAITNPVKTKSSDSVCDAKCADFHTSVDDERKHQVLRALIKEGLASGAAEYRYESLVQELDDELGN